MKYAIEQNFVNPDHVMKVAIFGNLELVKFLFENGYEWYYNRHYEAYMIGNFAILSGNVDLAKYVFTKCSAKSQKDVEFAARSNNIDTLRYVITLDPGIDNNAFFMRLIIKI
jgi:hypothetical protein